MDVFISYSREDKDAAKHLNQHLREKGIRTWIDIENLVPGQRWKVAISEAIKMCRFFLPLLSRHSVSAKGYFHKELKEALEILDMYPIDQIYLIPVRLDDCIPSHPELREINWVDLFPNWDHGIKKIVDGIKFTMKLTADRVVEEREPISPIHEEHIPIDLAIFTRFRPLPPTRCDQCALWEFEHSGVFAIAEGHCKYKNSVDACDTPCNHFEYPTWHST